MKITDLFEDASIKRSIKKILKTADPSYPQQRILSDANEYCDGFGAASTHPVEYYDWHYVERCPTSIIVHYDAMAKWMDGEIKMWAEEGQPDRYDDEINNPIREPVLLVNKHNGLDIVDGRHRVGGAAKRGDAHVPAYIGVPKSWGTAPAPKIDESYGDRLRYFGGFRRPPTREETNKYMGGWCPYFALALHDLYGFELVAVGEHVLARNGDDYYDVRGKMTEEQAKTDLGDSAVRQSSKDELMQQMEEGTFSCGFFAQSTLNTATRLVKSLMVKPKLEESAAPYTQEELEHWDVDDLDRMAFGYVEGDVVTVDPDEIKIIWHMDLENPEYKFKQGGMDWVRSVDFSEPLELSVNEEGELQLENGHHRWFASKKLGRKVTGVIDKIKGKPIRRILKLQAEGKIKRPVEESAVSHDTSIGIVD